MDLIKFIKSRRVWTVIISVVLINLVVSANKRQSNDLLNEYYGGLKKTDTTKISNKKPNVDPEFSKRDSIVNFAETLLGKSYKYGTEGPDQFDCSGYVYYVFNNFDFSLSRSTKYQSREGKLISRDSIKKGDLLFFKSPSPNNPNIGHVGIAFEATDGKIKFIHSSTNRGVVIDSLGSRHYGSRFMEARRVLN